MRVLELFCGTKSIGKPFERDGHEVVSVDIDPKFEPTICANILDIPLDMFEPGTFQYVHASCPCTNYSLAKTNGAPRDLDGADAIVLRTINMIRHLRPVAWTIENPATGMLKTRPFMAGLSYTDVSYCHYGMPYRKNTRLWHSPNLDLSMLRLCKKDCASMVLNCTGRMVHLCSAQHGPSRGKATDRCFKAQDLYVIPAALCEEIYQAVVLATADHLPRTW